jgi:DNA-binding NtrC family response regulator
LRPSFGGAARWNAICDPISQPGVVGDAAAKARQCRVERTWEGGVAGFAAMDQKVGTILVADDESACREVLKTAMTSWGYTVYEAIDGEEAWRRFLEQSPALIVADLVMPNLSGLELLRRVKAVKPDTEVIIVSAYGSMNDALTAMREGAIDFLTKPTDYARLKSLLEACVALAGATATKNEAYGPN